MTILPADVNFSILPKIQDGETLVVNVEVGQAANARVQTILDGLFVCSNA